MPVTLVVSYCSGVPDLRALRNRPVLSLLSPSRLHPHLKAITCYPGKRAELSIKSGYTSARRESGGTNERLHHYTTIASANGIAVTRKEFKTIKQLAGAGSQLTDFNRQASRLAKAADGQPTCREAKSALHGRGGPAQNGKKCIPHPTILPTCMGTQSVGQSAPPGNDYRMYLYITGG